MTGFTDEDLDDFRKEVGNRFYVPLNYQLFGRIANMPMWERVLFVWKHKKQHGCGSLKEKERHDNASSPSKAQEPKGRKETEGRMNRKCIHCRGDLNIRNPKGFCDHLHYPEYCSVCLINRKTYPVVRREK